MNGLRSAFDEYAADVPEYGDLDRAIEQADSDRRRRSALVTTLAAVAAVLVVVAGVVAIASDGTGSQQHPTDTPSRTPSADATPSEWPGAVRPGTSSWPVVAESELGQASDPWRGFSDDRDLVPKEIDIRVAAGRRLARVSCAGPCWIFGLRADPPPDSSGATGVVHTYGAIVDSDGDRVGDCQLQLTTDAPGGKYRASLRNLRTGATSEQVGPPYGYPYDFSILSRSAEERTSAVALYFLRGVWRGPCDAPAGPVQWYAYAAVMENGQVTAWDFAPDAAWLQQTSER